MIFEYRNALTSEECLQLIELSKDKLIEATTLGPKQEDYRTAQNCWISELHPAVTKVKLLVREKTGLPVENQELVHIVKYTVGGQYKNHHDFFHPDTDYYQSQISRGGQRLYSCMFYLNDDFQGGETEFPELGVTIQPEACKMIVWSNVNSDNSLDYTTLHAGLPVTQGEKWICLVWVRENQFK